jgi:misacylated tRNA(Ala) deacylase
LDIDGHSRLPECPSITSRRDHFAEHFTAFRTARRRKVFTANGTIPPAEAVPAATQAAAARHAGHIGISFALLQGRMSCGIFDTGLTYYLCCSAMTELLFRDDAYLRTATARVAGVHERGLELDRTIFYPLGGGQPGDTGALVRASGERIPITDTRKGSTPDSVLHIPPASPETARAEVGETVTLEIDWVRRYALMRLHTALHVMSCVVVAPVTGGNISPDKGRLDFDIDMTLLDAAKIERETNALIARGLDTETVWITDEELDARPDLVKTMSVQPPRGAGRVRLLRIPGVDLQPCGGTHVKNIGEIGAIRVLKIRSEGKHNKRVEIALVG